MRAGKYEITVEPDGNAVKFTIALWALGRRFPEATITLAIDQCAEHIRDVTEAAKKAGAQP